MGATGIGNTWYLNDSCSTPVDAKRDPIMGDLLLNTENCEICCYTSMGWEETGKSLNCATNCDSILQCLLDLPRPEDTCVFTLQLPSCDNLFQQSGGVSVLQITINNDDQLPVPIGNFSTPADLANLLQPLGWQWIPTGQTNLYLNQFSVMGDPTEMGIDNSFTFSFNNKNVSLAVQCQSDQCNPCQNTMKGGDVLLLKDDKLKWVPSECLSPTGTCQPEQILNVICNDVQVPEVSCEYCGYLDPDCFDFLNDLDASSTEYKIATTKMNGDIVLGFQNFNDDGELLDALNALNAIRIGDSLIKIYSSPEPISYLTFYNQTNTPIANVKLAEFNCCPTGIDQDTKILSKITGGLAWVNADCLVKDDINLTEKILSLPQCQDFKCTIIFDVCLPFNKNNLNFPWTFSKFTILGANQPWYIGKTINSPQDIFNLLQNDPINDWTPVCPTGSCEYQLCVYSDSEVPDEESCYSLEDNVGHIFINKDMNVDCHQFQNQDFQIIVSGSKDGVFLCDAPDIIGNSLKELDCLTVPDGQTCVAILQNDLKVLAMGQTSCYWIPQQCVGGGVCSCDCDCQNGNTGGGEVKPCDLDEIPDCGFEGQYDIQLKIKKDLIDIINCHFVHNEPYWIANYKLSDGTTIDACQAIDQPFGLKTLGKAFEDLGWIVVPESCNITTQTDDIMVFKNNSSVEIISVCINILGNKGEQLPISYPIPVFCLTNVGCTGLFEECKVLIRGPEPGDYCFVDKDCLMPTPQVDLPKELSKLDECDSDVQYKVCLCLDECDVQKLNTVFGEDPVLKILHYELVGGEIVPVNQGLPNATLEDLVNALLAEGWGISSGSVVAPPVTLEICGPNNIQYVAVHDNSSILVAPYPVLLGVTCTVFKNCESQNPDNMVLIKKPDNEICWTPICPNDGGDGKQLSPVIPITKHFLFTRRNNQAPSAQLGGAVRLVAPSCPGDTQAEVSHLICDSFEWAVRAGSDNADGLALEFEGSSVSDSVGNIYKTFFFTNLAPGDTRTISFFNFDNSVAFTEDNAGGNAIYVGKISPRGVWIWVARVFDTDPAPVSDLRSPNIDVDSDDYLYISFEVGGGDLNGLNSLTFVNSNGITFEQSFLANPDRNFFVTKINTSGAWLWGGAATVNSINNNTLINEDYPRNNDLSVDCVNNYINVVGTTDREVLYFFNAGNTGASPDLMLDGPTGSTGVFDIFAASLDNNGDWRWRARVGVDVLNSSTTSPTDLNEVQPKISTDCHGNSYIVGQAETVGLEFFSDPDNQINPFLDNLVFTNFSGLTGPFIFSSRINQNGIWTDAQPLLPDPAGFTGTSNLTTPDVASDCDGNIYLTGIFNNIRINYTIQNVEYHSGLTAGNINSIFNNNNNQFDNSDFFIFKSDRNQGSNIPQFSAKIGGASDENMPSVSIDSQGQAYVGLVSTSEQVRFYNNSNNTGIGNSQPSFFRSNMSSISQKYMVVVTNISSQGAWNDRATLLVTNAIDPQLSFDCDDNLILTITVIADDPNPTQFINPDMTVAFAVTVSDTRQTMTVKIARDQVAQTLGFLTSLPDIDNRVTAEFPGKQVSIPNQSLVPSANYYLDCSGLTSNCCCGQRFMGTACSVREILAHNGRPCQKCSCKP